MSDEIVPAPVGVVDLFAPSVSTPQSGGAGKGSEDFGSNDVIVPRASLLQSMSKALANKNNLGAMSGGWWLTPLNRPLSSPSGENGLPTAAKIVVARIMPSQRRWKPLNEGGGLECEAPGGTGLIARQPNGLTEARIEIEKGKKGITGVIWEGGKPTNSCQVCCYGPGAAAAAAGRVNTSNDRGGSWLPKMINVGGEMTKLPDEYRAPRCTQGFDVLVYVLVPAFGSMPAEIMPAMITFARSSYKAGVQLGSMLKLSARDPAWAKIYEIGAQSVTNDKGTFNVATVSVVGSTHLTLQRMAEELYDSSKEQQYSSPFEDVEEVDNGSHPVARDDAPAPSPEDKF